MNGTIGSFESRTQKALVVDAEPLYLGAISHHARTAAAVTIGYVELLEKALGEETLAQVVIPGNGREKPYRLADLLHRIRGSQQRLILALERVERESEEWESTTRRVRHSG